MSTSSDDTRPSDPTSSSDEPHRAGFVGLVGRPNAGKSTLLNQVLGQKLSIVSAKPQTTRNRLLGIHTVPGMQAVLVDTPGIHAARSRLNKAMVAVAAQSLAEVDVVCWVIDLVPAVKAAQAGRPPLSKSEREIARMIQQAGGSRVTVALNKADIVKKPWILPVIDAVHQVLPDAVLVPISALTGGGTDELVAAWRHHLPEGPAVFPPDQVTDQSERFIVAELIREKLFHLTQQEVPYSTAVEIELFEEQTAEPKEPVEGEPFDPDAFDAAAFDDEAGERTRVHVMARILVERDSQKGIVIGKGGSMLKQVGILARRDIEKLLGCRVFLELHVSVRDAWSESGRALKELGYE
ncbi:MAG: GTPase Era [Alphaproteobacteria bacterium]|nr:GTPase Era [Alphaproteobacteria bacterium]